jgi:hypothetical protein
MLAIITSPATTPVGLARVSDVPLPLFVVAVPRCWMPESMNVAEALSWEESPVAVAWNVAPIKSEEKTYQLV